MLTAALPPELQCAILELLDVDALIAAAATCHSLCALADATAMRHCHRRGLRRKGSWCKGASWRVMLRGRSFRNGMRVRRFLGGSSTRKTRGVFHHPTAIAALPDARVAVCNAHTRTIVVVDVDSGECLASHAIDGSPCGICWIPGRMHPLSHGLKASVELFAVSVQGLAESGEPIAGVRDSSHRVEFYAFDAMLSVLSGPCWRAACTAGGPELSFPNGIALLCRPMPHADVNPPAPLLACSDWNNRRVALLSTDGQRDAAAAALQAELAFGWPQLRRPADCAMLLDGATLAVIDYYGDAVYLIDVADTPYGSSASGSVSTSATPTPTPTAATAAAAATAVADASGAEAAASAMPRATGRVEKRRRGQNALERPSGLCVDPTSGRLLVAESGAQCIAVFWVEATRGGSERGCSFASMHICDICVEQLGTGLHVPHRGEWSWLALDCTLEGDVLVADCDNHVVYIV